MTPQERKNFESIRDNVHGEQTQEKTSWTLEDVKKSWKSGYQAGLEQAQKQDQFCDNNCVWTDHHPNCVIAQKQEPVAFRTESRITKAVGYWSDRVPDYIDANSWEITPLYTKEQL